MRPLTAHRPVAHYSIWTVQGGPDISNDRDFNSCVVLDREAFDPDAVFLDDIVDDDVLPRLSLSVEGLTDTVTASKAEFELAVAEGGKAEIEPSTELPAAEYDPEQLEVYGWESSLWRKIRGYLGF